MANLTVAKIQAAQQAINTQQYQTAEQLLSQAQELINNIQATGPTVKVIEHIRTARKQLERSANVPIDLAPLASEIADVQETVPVGQAREHLTTAQQNLQSNHRHEAGQNLETVEHDLVYAEADLPVSRTKADILSAEALLYQNNPDEAAKMLQDSLNHISVLTIDTAKQTPVKTTR